MNISLKTFTSLTINKNTARENYGDWQTSYEFAKSVCLYLKNCGIKPDIIVEPTCGIGNFIAAAIDVFHTVKKVYGVEISEEYISQTEQRLQKYKNSNRIDSYRLYNTNVFSFAFDEIANENKNEDIGL